MTTSKLPPDSELATPIGGKDIDPELEAKLKDKKNKHKRHRFQVLITQRLIDGKFRFKQIKNCCNRSNYIYTENEAKAIIKYLEDQIDDLANVFLDPSKEFNAQPIQFDTTEYD